MTREIDNSKRWGGLTTGIAQGPDRLILWNTRGINECIQLNKVRELIGKPMGSQDG